jgi:nitrate/nitrite transport system ATP-binding protein
MAVLELRSVSKGYGVGGSRTEVLADVSLQIDEGEFLAIVGFSGSGKTTLINLMAGLITPDRGDVMFRGVPVTEPGPERSVVFQSYSLMPWLSVENNVRLAVDAVAPNLTAREQLERTLHYVEMVGLGHARTRKPAELSGGMRQRVAVARALAMRPEVLLLDEPLSALDALTRSKLQSEIEQIWSREKKTVVLITNDVDEAVLLADRVVVLNPGPNASFGPEFRIDVSRPRKRGVDLDPAAKHLRSEITQYLFDVGVAGGARGVHQRRLPAVAPKRLDRSSAAPAGSAPPPDNRYVEFFEVGKSYSTSRGPLAVVDDFSLLMRRGEFISLIGHSGCGKSTVLSMVAGLNEVSSGGIVLDGTEISGAGPDRAVVFQSPSLLPWLTARENVALGVERVFPHATRQESEDIVSYYLERVGLADAMDKPASKLSNGMKQRVGIARAFALEPKLLLLDEPFGMLDSLTRWQLQEVLMEIWSRTQVTAICVTHDVDEAILLADRVVMMTNGPNARIGKIMNVEIPRPRSRPLLLEHPRYDAYRQELLSFLDEHENAPASAGSRKVA